MIGTSTFVCPSCAHLCTHPLEVYFQWCPICRRVTGIPRPCPHQTAQPETPWKVIRDNQDDCMIAIENRTPLATRALQALPPWRAVQMARLADAAGVGLQEGTLDQIRAEAAAVSGDGKLGDWWTRRV